VRLHEGQLSLLEVDQGPVEPLTNEPSNGSPLDATRRHKAAEIVERASSRETERSSESPTDSIRITSVAAESRRVANRQLRDPSRDENRSRPEILEKHYKTRAVAELLSVHEETVLRLAQCGNLRSVRVGSERRYPESAIVEFLERNADQTALKLRAAGRRS
jgi:excisionase family DNA binding protein